MSQKPKLNRKKTLTVIYATKADSAKRKPEKNSGLNRIQTCNICNVVAVLYQLTYQVNSQYDQLLFGLIAQLIEHYTRIAEVMGLNPVQA